MRVYSVVATLYRSEASIEEFVLRVSRMMTSLGWVFEIVLVDDGSPDSSFAKSVELKREFPEIRVVRLSRNYGHHLAMMAGLEHARGQRVFLLDSDLEEQPEWLPEFVEVFESRQSDLVFGVQENRKGGPFEKISGAVYHSLMAWLSDGLVPRNWVTARLMSRRFVDSLLEYRVKSPVLGAISAMNGFSQVSVPIQKLSISPTTYSFKRRMALFVDTVILFGSKPLQLAFWAGLLLSGLAMAATLALVAIYFFRGVAVEGWTSVMVSVWFFGGLNLAIISLIGRIQLRTIREASSFPRYSVMEIVD